MSGHSKFANIKHKKEKNDAAKGKIFTIIGREIAVAVKEGGPDPNNNAKLRDVIAKAKSTMYLILQLKMVSKKQLVTQMQLILRQFHMRAMVLTVQLSSLIALQTIVIVQQPTFVQHLQRAAEASAHLVACPSCLTTRDRSSSPKRNALWKLTTL